MDAEFAARSRERCAPHECIRTAQCWVIVGGFKTLVSGKPVCKLCGGLIRENKWITPQYEQVLRNRPD